MARAQAVGARRCAAGPPRCRSTLNPATQRNGVSGKIARAKTVASRRHLFTHTNGSATSPRRVDRDVRESREALPTRTVPGDFQAWCPGSSDPSVTWDDLAWLRETGAQDFPEGDSRPRRPRQAVVGAPTRSSSRNHGGRPTDTCLDHPVMPRSAAAVAGKCEVLMDGGIRSGLDVVRRLSMGARACLVGRTVGYAVAARGQRGVEQSCESSNPR